MKLTQKEKRIVEDAKKNHSLWFKKFSSEGGKEIMDLVAII